MNKVIAIIAGVVLISALSFGSAYGCSDPGDTDPGENDAAPSVEAAPSVDASPSVDTGPGPDVPNVYGNNCGKIYRINGKVQNNLECPDIPVL